MQKVLIALALGLSGAASAAAAAQQDAAMLVYRVWEPGLDPYVSRVLVTPQYVRMDEGQGSDSYTLYDRKQDVMYNVSAQDHSALVMKPPAADIKLPADLTLTEQVSEDGAAPKIDGRSPQHVKLLANGTVCREMVTVPGLMPAAVAGLREFQALLGRIQFATLGAFPAGSQSPCDLAENVYAPLRSLSHGLPIQERSDRHSRSLVDFVPAHQVDATLFSIPKDYMRSPMPGLMSE